MSRNDSRELPARVGLERLPEDLSELELVRYFHVSDSVREVIDRVREPEVRIGLAIQAGAVLAIGRFLGNVAQAPLAVVRHVCTALGLAVAAPRASARRDTRWLHEKEILKALGYSRFTREMQPRLHAEIERLARNPIGEEPLLAKVEEFLRTERFLLPPAASLRRLIRNVRARSLDESLVVISGRLDKAAKQRLAALLLADSETGVAPLTWLSKPPGDPKVDNLQDLIARKKKIESLKLDLRQATGLPDTMEAYLIQRAHAYDLDGLAKLAAESRYGYLVLRMKNQYRRILDWITFMHGALLHGVRRRAKNAVVKETERIAEKVPEYMDLLGRLCEIVLDHRETPEKIGPEILRSIAIDVLEEALAKARAFTTPGARSAWDYLLRRHRTIKTVTTTFLENVPLASTAPAGPITDGIDYYKELKGRRRPTLPKDAPTAFVPRNWKKRVIDAKGRVNRKAWEMCLAEQVTEGIKSGALTVPGSGQFEAMDRDLVDPKEWRSEKERLVEGLPVAVDPVRHFKKLGLEIAESACGAAGTVEKKEGVRIVAGRIVVTPLEPTVLPVKQLRICQEIQEALRTRRIEDILLEVHKKTGYLNCFTHLGSGRVLSADDWEARTALFSAILAKGFNHGIATLARSIDGMTRWKIETAAAQYLREETLQAAIARLVDFQTKIPMVRAWGEGKTASADGKKYRVEGESLYAGYNPKYFPGYKRGIVVLTHVSDLQTPFYTQVVPVTVREAGYILDGLLGHGSGLKIEQQYVDTHGFTEVAMAFCHMLGVRLAPRIADLGEQRLWLAADMKREDFGKLAPIFAGYVESDHLATHWDEMLRMAVSMREGRVKPSVLIRKVATLPRKNTLFRAWQDLGRLVKTHFLLDYIRDKELRRKVLEGLNKGEERNGLAKRFFHGTDGGFRTGDHLAQLYAASCLNLLIACVSVSNALEYDREWKARGGESAIPLSWLKPLSAFATEAVIYLGKYSFPQGTPETWGSAQEATG